MGIVRGKLNENPDIIKSVMGKRYGWGDDDDQPMPFGFWKGELFINLEGGMHGGMPGWYEIMEKLPQPKGLTGKPRTYLEYPGRLWKTGKIMSFWKYC